MFAAITLDFQSPRSFDSADRFGKREYFCETEQVCNEKYQEHQYEGADCEDGKRGREPAREGHGVRL